MARKQLPHMLALSESPKAVPQVKCEAAGPEVVTCREPDRENAEKELVGRGGKGQRWEDRGRAHVAGSCLQQGAHWQLSCFAWIAREMASSHLTVEG